MPKDGLRRLPDHVVAPLLRALMCIPRRPDARLILKPAEDGRPPSWDKSSDYDVMFRGRRVGRVWRFDYQDDGFGDRMLWHWYWRDVEGRLDARGHAPTLETAMADFRRAWDTPASGVA
jgi:hypothetical protein